MAPAFICVANIAAADGGARIVAGNERVLSARLADARFFWERDLVVPLESLAPKLKDIVFHAKLGTLADKVERVARLARWLAERIPGCDADLAERAARLAKCDLVTGTVGEFPEVQGIAGGYLARAQGEPAAVAHAVRDHYKPVGQGDEVPTAPVTVAVALADKLDTVAAFFSISELPTGSKDPFALRRAMLGAIGIVERAGLRIQWRDMTREAQSILRFTALLDMDVTDIPTFRGFGDSNYRFVQEDEQLEVWYGDKQVLVAKAESAASTKRALAIMAAPDIQDGVLSFLADRLKVQQRDAGTRHDVIDAVFALGDDDLVRLLARVRAVQGFIGSADGANLLAGYRRAANILKKEGYQAEAAPSGVEGGADGDRAVGGASRLGPGFRRDDVEDAERALHDALTKADPAVAAALAAEDFDAAMRALATLRPAVDAFFDQVKVNADDPDVRLRRLALLAAVRDAMHRVADFSRIEG